MASAYDQILGTFAPIRAARNMEARMNMEIAAEFFSTAGGYDATDRRSMGGSASFPSDADSSIIGLETMRA